MSDVGNPKDVASAKREARLRTREGREVVRGLLATPGGRAWFWNVLEFCHLYGTSFATNALVMAFREGERNVGQMLLAECMVAAPEAYLEMVTEHERRKDDRDAGNGTAGEGAGTDLDTD